MLTSEEIQKQISVLEESLGKLKESLIEVKKQEEEARWFEKKWSLDIPCASGVKGDKIQIEDAYAQEDCTNVERSVIYLTVFDDSNDEKVTSHLNLEGAIQLRDFLNKRIDFHGNL